MNVTSRKRNIPLNTRVRRAFQPSRALLTLLPGLIGDLPKNLYNKLLGCLRADELDSDLIEPLYEILEAMKRDGGCHHRFYRIYQFVSLTKKLPGNNASTDCNVKAFSTFLAGEAQCRDTNERIRSSSFIDRDLAQGIKSLISEILGPLPIDFLKGEPSFGPGSTVNPEGRLYRETTLYYKLSDRLYVESGSAKFLAAHMSYNPNWVDALGIKYSLTPPISGSRLQFELDVFKQHLIIDDVVPNRIGFVPKNAEESRCIGIEPNGKVLLQKSLGNLIRKRLRKYGLNLDSQGRNQHLARLSKIFGLATIDLKNASNTLAIEVVRQLLPEDWFTVLNSFRSSHGTNPFTNETFSYEMFSSMGNGFTFELESLIFFAICVSCIKKYGCKEYKARPYKSCTVFGDDIIVPVDIAPITVNLLGWFGFTVNKEKSYFSGYFFESCGADYFDSHDVRPFFLKRDIRTTKDIFFLCNSIVWYCLKRQNNFLAPLYSYLLQLLPSRPIMGPLHFYVKNDGFRHRIDGLEDVLRVPLDVAQSYGCISFDTHNLQSFIYKKYVHITVHAKLKDMYPYARSSFRYLTFLQNFKNGDVPLKGVTKSSLRRFSTSSWNGNLRNEEVSRLLGFFLDVRW